MAVSLDLQDRLTHIDEQLLRLIGERIVVCQKALEEDEEALSASNQTSIVSHWEEAADEEGWNPGLTLKLIRTLNELGKNLEE